MHRVWWIVSGCLFLLPIFSAPLTAQQAAPGAGELKYEAEKGLTVAFDDKGKATYLCFDASSDDSALAQLLSYPTAVYLELSRTRISDDGAASLGAFTTIKVLHLEDTDVGDDAVAALASLEQLEVLNLGGTKVTDEGVAKLSGLPNLKELRLHGTAVTDASLEKLASLKKLESLWVQNTKVTTEGVKKLEEALRRKIPLNGGTQISYTVRIKYTPREASSDGDKSPPEPESADDK